MARATGRTEGATPTVQSPPWQPTQGLQPEPCNPELDDVSMGSSDPRAHRDQRQVLEDMRREDACVTIKRRRETRRQSDRRNGPDVDEPVPGGNGYLPFEVGCPAFTS